MSSARKIPVSVFKAKALGILDEVGSSGKTVIVTRHGKPLAQVVPCRNAEGDDPVPDRLAGALLDEQDIVSPLGASLWKAAKP